MSSISLLPGLLKGGSLSGTFQSQSQLSRKRADGDARAAAAGDLTRALLKNAAAASGTAGTTPTTTGGTGNPLTANLGNVIDLRATMVHAVDDASLTIKTAEGDTVTLTAHTEVNALKAKLTYAPSDAPAGAAGAAPSGAKPAQGHDDGDGDDDKAEGVTKGSLREIQIDEKISVSVQGDLSEQELSDIKKLVSNLGSALKDFRAGADHDNDQDGGANSLTKLDTSGFGSLAGFELHAEHTVDVTRIHIQRLPDAPPPPVVAASDPTVAPGKGSINTTPVATNAPPAKPKPGDKPVAPGAAPKTPAAPVPAWKVQISSSHVHSVADMLRSSGNTTTPASIPGVLDPNAPATTDTPTVAKP